MTGSVAQQITELIQTWNQREAQLRNWLGGSANGGPNNDGRYPLVDALGRETLVPSPAHFADMVEGPAAAAVTAMANAGVYAEAADLSAQTATTKADLAAAHEAASIAARNLAKQHRSFAGNHEANARYWAELAEGMGANTTADRIVVEQLREEAVEAASEATGAASNAAASAAAAQTFNPANYDRKTDTLDADRIVGVLAPDRIPVLPSQLQFASSGDLSDLTQQQQDEIGQGSIVTTTDGYRRVYGGVGSKTSSASYTVLADLTPEWTSITGKPSSFPASAHGHSWNEITGFTGIEYRGLLGTTDLNTVSTTGVYQQNLNVNATAARHYPTADYGAGTLEVYGLVSSWMVQRYTTYHDGRSYVRSGTSAAAMSPWREVSYSGHVHGIGDVSGLQSALDAKASLSGANFGSGQVRANLTHNNGYFEMYPYGSAYDEGSRLRLYWDGVDSQLVLGKTGGTGGAARIYLNGRGYVWDATSLDPTKLLAADGTVSAPTISFANDSNSGFYSVSNGIIGLTINGVERARFAGNDLLLGASKVWHEGSLQTFNLSTWQSWQQDSRGNNRFYLHDDGHVYFRAANSTTGNFYFQTGAGQAVAYFYGNRRVYFYNTVQMPDFSITSDERLKTDILPLTDHARFIDGTNVYSYWKNGRFEWGPIAQEMQKGVAPFAVIEADEENEQGFKELAVNDRVTLYALLAEVKDLRVRLAEAGL